jgi:hypothetical protein
MKHEDEQVPPADAGRLETPVRPYLLDVRDCGGDDVATLMSKGHHDHAAFLKACEEHWGAALPKGGDGPVHTWWRWVPARPGSEYRGYYHEANPGERGAFPCTAITWW